jgi:plasmid stabilization system protein ParE
MKIEYHPAIEFELREIVKFYNEISKRLGAEFLNEFEKQVLRISAMPTRWVIVENNIQRALLKRFPFAIYFRVFENDVIRILIVKHQRRHPSYGIERN